MYKLRIIIILTVITSCQSTRIHTEDFVGKYKYRTNKKVYNFDYILKLDIDTTFYLQISNQNCNGKWTLLDKSEIILKCNNINSIDALSSSYFSQREYTVRLLKGDSLKLIIYNSYLPSIPLLNQAGKSEEIILKKEK